MTRARMFRAIALAAVLAIGFAIPVSGAARLQRLYPYHSNTNMYATFLHDGAVECEFAPTFYYRVKMKMHVGTVTATSFYVNDLWITYEVVRGRVWTNLMFMSGSYGRWPSTGTKFQGHYLGPGTTKTYYYDVNKTFTKDVTVENRASYSDPNDDFCAETDQWALYVY